MVGFRIIDMSTHSLNGEFYATNNQFQRFGPKGFIEVKVLENNKLYVRADVPGLPDIKYNQIFGDEDVDRHFRYSGSINDEKEGVRRYSLAAGLGCDCCNMTDADINVKNGVLRMIISRVKVKDHEKKCTLTYPPFTGKSGSQVEDHPFVEEGRKGAFFGEPTADGGLYLAVDFPGVGDDDHLVVTCNETGINFGAEIIKVYEHDEVGRFYHGNIDTSHSLEHHEVNHTISCGVLKIFVKPPQCNTDNE